MVVLRYGCAQRKLLAVTIVYRRVLNHVWKERAKNAKKCFVVVGFNPQNKSIVKSIAKKARAQTASSWHKK